MKNITDSKENSQAASKNEQNKIEELKADNNISQNNEGENESFDSDENAEESANYSENESEFKKHSKSDIVKKDDEEIKRVMDEMEVVVVKPESIANPRWKEKTNDFLQNIYFQGVMGMITIYILFADDIKLLTTKHETDYVFSIICILIIFLYSFEFTLSCLVVEKYNWSFYFWLDLLSILAMFLDVDWIYDGLIYGISGQDGSKRSKNNNAKTLGSIFRAGRAAKIGSRAIRVLRIVRLLRLNKLYKNSEKYLSKKREMEKEKSLEGDNKKSMSMSNNNIQSESKVGKKLSDLTTSRVIILVLSMMIGIILFNSSFYYESKKSMDLGIKIFKTFDKNDPNLNMTFDIYVNEHLNISAPILYAQVGNLTYGDFNFTETLRDIEKIVAFDNCPNIDPDPDIGYCLAIFDNRMDSIISSILNISKTIFVCIIFSFGSMFFFSDVLEMVLAPIESMTRKVQNMANNPMMAFQEAERLEFFNALIGEQKKGCCTKKKKTEPLETEILEKTISKIGALLVLGFGEAGSEIIAKNLSNDNDGEVNPMIPGKKVIAIYGFCDIRNFTDTTEVLQERVMVFVNEIAEIVHEITTDHCGSANKNIGDAFLLIWKFEDRFTEEENGELRLKYITQVNQIVDCSLITFLKILSKVQKSYKLDKYRKDKELNERINNFSVKIGFGLHLGWSIEGAIGSVFKIDASYLSPNVNMSSKLEEKTKVYGTQLIFSGEVYDYLSPEARDYARIIDIIEREGEEEFRLYTIDFDLSDIPIEKEEDFKVYEEEEENLANNDTMNKLKKYKKRLERKEKYDLLMSNEVRAWENYIKKDPDWKIMRNKYNNPYFYEEYNNGFDEYVNGNWKKAKSHFEMAESILGETDGPIQHLLKVMGKFSFEQPESWRFTGEGDDH